MPTRGPHSSDSRTTSCRLAPSTARHCAGYEHLAPLFAERAALPVGHPRRQPLRCALISGYLPVARHIARKYFSRGENRDDLEGLQAQHMAHCFSLDEPVGDEDDRITDRVRFASALGHLEARFDLVDHRAALAPLLAELQDRERRILLLRFVDGLTQTEIAEQVGISQMHVSRLLSRTLARLRRGLGPQ